MSDQTQHDPAVMAERDFLLRSLSDLDDEQSAGDLASDDYVALRDDYVKRAADVLRQLEGSATPVETAAPTRRGRPVLAVVGSIVIAAVAGIALANSVGSRSGNQPLTGSLPTSTQDELRQAADYLGQGRAIDAVKTYDAILKRDPTQPVALAYRGWVVRLAGLKAEGLSYVDRAVAADPSYADAHFFRGMMLWEDKLDPAGAVVEFRLFLANNPPQAMIALVENALKRASAEAGIPVE